MADLLIGSRLRPLNLDGFPQIILQILQLSYKEEGCINILAERASISKDSAKLDQYLLTIVHYFKTRDIKYCAKIAN